MWIFNPEIYKNFLALEAKQMDGFSVTLLLQ